jgi:hypothetical protein
MRRRPGPKRSTDPLTRGKRVAAILAGAWRTAPPPLPPCEMDEVVGLLAAGGAGGLAWHRLRETLLATSAPARELRQHYRLQTLQAVDREDSLRTLLKILRGAGVEPLLIKGWSSARLYAESGLRPSGDIDLCIAPEKIAAAITALAARPLPCAVDLHIGVPDLPDRSWSRLWNRARLVALADTEVRVLGPEDQLRLLCLHLARHGVARPLWLCDVAACLEAIPADFAWDDCLSGEKYLSSWSRCILGLACRLLGSRSERSLSVPAWVEQAVLRCWGISATRGVRPIQSALRLGLGPTPWMPSLLLEAAAFVRRKVPHVLRRLVHRSKREQLPFTIHRH